MRPFENHSNLSGAGKGVLAGFKSKFGRAVAALPILFAATPGMAAEPEETQSPPSAWTFEAGAYAFVPLSVQGTSTISGGTVDLDLGPEEIFELFEFAISGRFEGWRDLGRGDGSAIGFVFDGQYVNLGANKAGIGPRSAGTVDIDIRQSLVDFIVGYRFPRIDLNNGPGQALSFDVQAGARYNFLRQKVDITPGLPRPFTVNLGEDQHWVEPVIGARGILTLNDRWDLVLRGDLAGFGVNGNNYTWSMTGLAAWRAWENTSLRIGYRVFDMNLANGSGSSRFGFDATEHGPFIGISHRF